MRRLDFTKDSTPKGAEYYELIYDGVLNTPRGFQAPQETRIVGKFLTQLEEIGKPAMRGIDPSGRPLVTFSLNDGGAVVLVEEEHHRMMSEALHSTRWNARGARMATEAIDWFDAAPAAMTDVGVDMEAKK